MFNLPFASAATKSDMEKIYKLFNGTGSNFIFEVELDKSKPAVDFSLCILKKEIQTLSAHRDNKHIEKLSQKNEKWHKILRFCSQWIKPGSLLENNIANIWFEFDNNQMTKELPEPCLFFTPKNLYNRPGCEKDKDNRFNLDWLFDPALKILIPGKMTKNLIVKVKECILALPQKGAIFQIGVLLSRNTDSLRLCTTMPMDKYPGYLKKIKWPGSFEYLEPALRAFKQYADDVFLDIDVGQDVLAKIGLECCYRKRDDLKRKLINFFDLLIELRICTEKNATLVIDWLSCEDKKETAWKRTDLKRNLSHIKVIIDKDNSASAKAYLSMSNLF